MACGREGALRLFIGLALLAPARAAVTTVAGSGEAGTTDGVGTAAKFSYPRSLTLHRTGDETLLVSHDYKIRSVQLETKAVGTWHTLTTKPQGAVFRSNGNTLYVAEVIQDGGTTSHRILAITPAGIGTCPPAGWDRCAPVTWPPPDNGHCCSKWGFLGNSDVHCSPEGLNALDGCCTINSFTGLLSCPAAGSPSVTTVRTVAGADDAGYMDSTVGASVRFNYPSGLAISPDDALLCAGPNPLLALILGPT